MSIEPELHATSDALLADLERLRELEIEKRDTPFDSPRLVELADEIERLARTVLGASDVQADLARLATARSKTGQMDGSATIEDAAETREVHAVLAEWREAERTLAEVGSASPEGVRLRARIEVLRTEYRQAHDAAARRSHPG